MNRLVVLSLRVTLVLLVLGAFLAQALIPIIAADAGKKLPELAHLVLPYSIAAIVTILCFQVALLAAWRLLSMVAQDRIFTDPARRWINVVVVCAAAATALGCSACLHLVFVEQSGGPGAVFGFAVCAVIGVTTVLMMVVVRGLLGTATADRHELVGVI